MILLFINIRKVPREGWKPRASPSVFNASLGTLRIALGFQRFPRDLADVNEWKIMFDPSIVVFPKK